MSDQTLTNIQKDKIYKDISGMGLDPRKFRWESEESLVNRTTTVSRLVYLPTPKYFFVFDCSSDGYSCEYSPGVEKRTEMRWFQDRSEQFNEVLKWLANLHLEIEMPDPWEQLVDGLIPSEVPFFAEFDTSDFSDAEKVKVQNSLAEFRRLLLSEFQPQGSELNKIDKRLEYLAMALDRLNKFDWNGVPCEK